MKRFASIDFLRGFAIFLMIFLHIISDTLNIDDLVADINNVPLGNIVALVILPFLGGLAGFFLMVSAVGNMISMQKHLQRGKSVKDLVVKQVLGGFILLIFAMLVEGIIGYHGALGRIFSNLDDPAKNEWAKVLYRWNYFETIHTIAWCVMLNGITQGILARNGKWKNINKMVRSYAILAIIVVILTPFIWISVSVLVPGYPYAVDPSTGIPIYMPVIGGADPLYIIASPFLAALASPIEPIFPYLAVSYIGSIIGIFISQPRKEVPRQFPKKMFYIGLIMFVVGFIGVIIVVLMVMGGQGFGAAVQMYIEISFHRNWFIDNPYIEIPPTAWLWQFLVLNGFSLMAVIGIIRLVEFRGIGKEFAERTTFIRRFGFIAFTNYTIQFIYFFIFFIVSLSFLGVPYAKLTWGLAFLTVLLSYLAYQIIMKLWEKKRYIGSLEWALATIALNIIPAKRDTSGIKKKWWKKGALNVEGAFYNAEWLNIVEKNEINHKRMEESKFAYKLSLLAVCSIIFMPITIATYFLSKGSQKTENINKYNKRAQIISIIGIIMVSIFIVLCAVATPADLGLYL
ncbi:MAG: heparan-alpha-glucosaminide N-acetyltransferase domain-containing protein [Promethearchaeia archaeon]